MELNGVPEGAHVVAMSLPGYSNSTSPVTVVAGETTSVNVALVPVTAPPTPTVSASPETSPVTPAPKTSPTQAPLSPAVFAGAVAGALPIAWIRVRSAI